MATSARPFGEIRHATIRGLDMAYIDEGEGDAIVFQHGNPTSSYLWRNVMPHCVGLGRLVACDLLGMGSSAKLPDPGPDSYHYEEQRDHLFALWDQLALGDRVTLVLHDWGSVLGFDWAMRYPERVRAIVYMEAIVLPFAWENWAEGRRQLFEGFRGPEGEGMVLRDNMFVETVLPRSVMRSMSDEEMAHYRAPYQEEGEARRPTLSWPRNIPIDGQPENIVRLVEEYGAFHAASETPKLFINAEPGTILVDNRRDFCRTWQNQAEVTVPGLHFIQEDSPDAIGEAIADFIRSLPN